MLVRMTDLPDDSILPEATYNVRVHDAKEVETPKTPGANPYVELSLNVTGPGEYSLGRRIYSRYPITGPGSKRLRSLLEVTGHPSDFTLTAASQLIGLEFAAVVGIEKSNGYPDKNVVKRHLPLLG